MACLLKYDHPLRVKYYKGNVIHAGRTVESGNSKNPYIHTACRHHCLYPGEGFVTQDKPEITCKACQAALFGERRPAERRFIIFDKNTGGYYKRSPCQELTFTDCLADASTYRTEKGIFENFKKVSFWDSSERIERQEFWNRRREENAAQEKKIRKYGYLAAADMREPTTLRKEFHMPDNLEIKAVHFILEEDM